MNTYEIIINIIRNKVAVMNILMKSEDQNIEACERLRHELTGMMICLKNITTEDKFYCTNFCEDRIEFGYYDADGKWVVIE